MHGIVHKRLEAYVVDRTSEESWAAVLERAGVESTLYLAVSTYDDAEIDAVLGALAELTGRDRRAIERDFGRTLAPALLSTFEAHVRDDRPLFDRLADLDGVIADVDASTDEPALPSVATRRASPDRVDVTYETHREHVYCGLAHGILEGIVDEAEANATVAEAACVRDGADACTFRVDRV